MLETIQNDIIAELQKIAAIKAVDMWQGDVELLLKNVKIMPSLYVIYQGAQFEPFQQAGEVTNVALDWLFILITQNVQSRAAGAAAAYVFIEAVRDQLIGHQVENYDFLRPVREDLLAAEGGILAYGMIYTMSNVMIETV